MSKNHTWAQLCLEEDQRFVAIDRVDRWKNYGINMKQLVSNFLVLTILVNSLWVGSAYADMARQEIEVSPELQRQQDLQAERAFNTSNKQLVVDSRFSSQITSPQGQAIPITVVEGQFGSTLSVEQRVAIGREMLTADAKIILFTSAARRNEAAIFKQTFELRNSERILIVEIPEANQIQLDRDVETNKKNVISRVATYTREGLTEAPQLLRNMVNISKSQFSPATEAEKASALKWGVAAVGMSMTVFFTFGVDISFAIGASLLSGLTTYLMEHQKGNIERLSRVDIFRDFKVTTSNRSLYQKLIIAATGNSILGVGQQGVEINPEAVLSGLATQRSQDRIEEVVNREVVNNAANRVTTYVKIMNGLLGAIATAGYLNYSFDLALFEITQIQLYIVAANATMAYVIAQFRKLESRIGSYDLRIATTQAFRNYRNKVIHRIDALVAKYREQRANRIALRNTRASEAVSDYASTGARAGIPIDMCSAVFNY